MAAPYNHHITIHFPGGKSVRSRVVYLQPKEERWREQVAVVHILCSEWLDPYWHGALYSTGAETYSGRFLPTTYELGEGPDYLFKGLFERTVSAAP